MSKNNLRPRYIGIMPQCKRYLTPVILLRVELLMVHDRRHHRLLSKFILHNCFKGIFLSNYLFL